MRHYFAQKRNCSTEASGSAPRASIINIDDEHGRRFSKRRKAKNDHLWFGARADVRTDDFRMTSGGMALYRQHSRGADRDHSPLVGRPHVYNTLAAVATGLALGFGLEAAGRGVAGCSLVRGRFAAGASRRDAPAGFHVIVDYAHTDDALKTSCRLRAKLRSRQERVITVFGCGGDRDRTKRAPNGRSPRA